jgi:hypothetical protein
LQTQRSGRKEGLMILRNKRYNERAIFIVITYLGILYLLDLIFFNSSLFIFFIVLSFYFLFFAFKQIKIVNGRVKITYLLRIFLRKKFVSKEKLLVVSLVTKKNYWNHPYLIIRNGGIPVLVSLKDINEGINFIQLVKSKYDNFNLIVKGDSEDNNNKLYNELMDSL